MTGWAFQNLSMRRPRIPITSADHAVTLLMDASGENEYAVCVEYFHNPVGVIDLVAGQEFATLSFDPRYDASRHSLAGFKIAKPVEPVTDRDMNFVDGTDTLSTIPSQYLLPILDVVRAVEYIVNRNQYPEFIQWCSRV